MSYSRPLLDWSALSYDKTGTTTQSKMHLPSWSTNYTSTPRIRTTRTLRYLPDIFELLCKTSKPARDLFIEIKQGTNYETHLAVLPYKHLTPSQKNKRSKAIIELENAGKGLARRVPKRGIIDGAEVRRTFRPSTFMLSPEYIYPAPSFADEIYLIWRQCAK